MNANVIMSKHLGCSCPKTGKGTLSFCAAAVQAHRVNKSEYNIRENGLHQVWTVVRPTVYNV